ncbi:MAG: tRNA uridine-5-carboxymethylaminomethyl(34) synthesis enzyme MnmG, partial [Phycisphaerae bacterium]|nr:tRNA uridine-5-carboxymethylaminomethyl(34) synthesis enzyme MnmG [Phycisphaerae bacterium]
GDAEPAPFSFMTERIECEQICCWLTSTTSAVHELIRANLDRAPMYSGQIESCGPRYCPSIETKIVRFADKDQHQIFLEPEGRDSRRIYANGISTSLPEDVQRGVVGLIPGLERARIEQYGYAIEYDFVPPEQIDATLMSKRVRGLFLAGQINGTSGYEEAAGQGIVAGINAVRHLAKQPAVTIGRDQGYIGVMIDDLVTQGVTEPYRMFTSRAEHRMHLRYDNADTRLTPIGREVGLVDDKRWTRFETQQQRLHELVTLLGKLMYAGWSIATWLKRPEEDGERFVAEYAELGPFRAENATWSRALVEIKYSGYIERQARVIGRFRDLEEQPIPPTFDYGEVSQLRREAAERLSAVRPANIGQAARVSGVHPADITILMLALANHDITLCQKGISELEPR